MVFVSLRVCAKENITQKSVTSTTARKKNTCQKRHPKNCKRYSSGKCRFKNDCAFKHPSSSVVKDQCEIEQKVQFLENIVYKLTLKLLNVEEELKLFKLNEGSETQKVKINEFKEDIKKPNLSSNKDIEKGLEDSREYSTEEEDDSVEVFPEIELSKISDKKRRRQKL